MSNTRGHQLPRATSVTKILCIAKHVQCPHLEVDMPVSRPSAQRAPYRATASQLFLVILLAACLDGQAPEIICRSSLQGTVRDPHSQPMADVKVYLQAGSGQQ